MILFSKKKIEPRSVTVSTQRCYAGDPGSTRDVGGKNWSDGAGTVWDVQQTPDPATMRYWSFL